MPDHNEALVEAALPAYLGWSNPNTGPENLRLYATDKGDSPRWDNGGRTVERALIERGDHREGDRYLVIRVGDRFGPEPTLDAVVSLVEARATADLRARVEAVLDGWRVAESRFPTLRVLDAELRAALDGPDVPAEGESDG